MPTHRINILLARRVRSPAIIVLDGSGIGVQVVLRNVRILEARVSASVCVHGRLIIDGGILLTHSVTSSILFEGMVVHWFTEGVVVVVVGVGVGTGVGPCNRCIDGSYHGCVRRGVSRGASEQANSLKRDD